MRPGHELLEVELEPRLAQEVAEVLARGLAAAQLVQLILRDRAPGEQHAGLLEELPSRAEAGDDGVTISVIDAGPALSEEVLARVFDRFYRADDSRSRLTEGTGLGLSICQAIVTRHGGTISAGTVGGVSNRFAIHLPDTPPPDTP